MEEGQNEQNQTPQQTASFQPTGSGVSFPSVGEQKKGGGAKMLLILGILILVGILGFVIYKSAASKSEITPLEPTPYENLTPPTQTDNGASSPTPTASTVSKGGVQIEIQNGTGIAGEAAYLQAQLKALGYTSVKAGNASQQNATATTVTFAKSLSSEVADEITKKLNAIYEDVNSTTVSSQTSDVVIITGLRKGATPKASATSTPTPTATPAE
jgi:hypothetical protein